MKFEEKHRPKTLDDIIFVDAYVERIVKETAANKRHKHLILHGPRGAGRARPQT
jgi:replication-associated recombination protein RarA